MGTWLETQSPQPVPLLLVDHLKRPAPPQICLPLIELGSLADIHHLGWVLKPPEAKSASTLLSTRPRNKFFPLFN